MKYRWNLVELKLKRLQALLLRNNYAKEQYDSIIKQYTYNDNLGPEDFLMPEPVYDISWLDAFKEYYKCTANINETLFDIITDLFILYGDSPEIFNNAAYTPLKMDNDELIETAYKIIKSMDASDVLELFEELVYKHKINIIEHNKMFRGTTEDLSGLTLADRLYNTSYINIFRNNTVQDIDSLVHETMHAYYNRLLFDEAPSPHVPTFMELEGEFGSMYSIKKMKDMGFPNTDTLLNSEIDYYLQNSYITLVTSLLFGTSHHNQFDLEELNNALKKYIKTMDVTIYENDLPNILGVNQYLCFANATAYLTAIDIMEKYDTPEALDIIGLLKLNDGKKEIIEQLNKYGITFHHDGLENYTKRYNLARKNTL